MTSKDETDHYASFGSGPMEKSASRVMDHFPMIPDHSFGSGGLPWNRLNHFERNLIFK